MNKTTTFTTEKELAVIEFYNLPMSMSKTAEEFNCSIKKINNILLKYNIQKHDLETIEKTCNNRTELSKEQEQELIIFYKNNSARATVDKYHLRLSRLNRILEKNNVDRHQPIKKEITEADIAFIQENYSKMSHSEMCKKLHITTERLSDILEQLQIEKHTKTESSKIANNKDFTDGELKELINFYAENNIWNTCRTFHTNPEYLEKILAENNIPIHTAEKKAEIKNKNQSIGLKKYFQENPDVAHRSHGRTRYIYNGVHFDSSWELAFWIYAKDNNHSIEREPISFLYYVGDKKHYYFPDFICNGKYIEIKGDHMLNNGKLKNTWETANNDKIEAKQRCMDEHNVKVLSSNELKMAFWHIKEKYGKDYLQKFRVTKLETNVKENTDE